MKHISSATISTIFALSLTGCSIGSGNQTSNEKAELAIEHKYRLFDTPKVLVSDLDECYTYTELKLKISLLEINPPPLVEATLTQKTPEGCPVRRGPSTMPLKFLVNSDFDRAHMESSYRGKSENGDTIVIVDYSQSTRRGVPREDNVVVTVSSAGANDQKLYGSMIKEAKEDKYRLFDTAKVIVTDLGECYTYTELSLLPKSLGSTSVQATLMQKSPEGCPVRRNVGMPLIFQGTIETNHGERTFSGKNGAGESVVMIDYTEATRRTVREDNVVVTITKNGEDQKLFGSRLKK